VCEFLGVTNKLAVAIANGHACFAGKAVVAAPAGTSPGPATLYVRPHHLEVTAPEASGLAGTVASLHRNGPVRHMEVDVPGAGNRLEVDLTNQTAPAIGEMVGLRITRASVFSAAGSQVAASKTGKAA
jgi:sulfate transport system ATP-binding protein